MALKPQNPNTTNQFAILRALHTGSNDHGVAGTIGLTGSEAGAVNLGGKSQAGTARPATATAVMASRPKMFATHADVNP